MVVAVSPDGVVGVVRFLVRTAITAVGVLVAAVIIGLNVFLLYTSFWGG